MGSSEHTFVLVSVALPIVGEELGKVLLVDLFGKRVRLIDQSVFA
jgi:hypothetical protein